MAVSTPVCDFDAPIVDFALPDPDGHLHRLQDLRGPNGTLVMFICNHCPYVQAVIDRITRDAAELQRDHGIGVVAISADIKTNVPKRKIAVVPMWMDRNGTLTDENPKQQKIKFLDANAKKAE